MLLNAAICQGYSFYRFWVIKGKPTGGDEVKCKITPSRHHQIRINRSVFSYKAFQSYLFGWKKDLLNFFFNFFIQQMKDLMNVKPKKNPLP